jgi:hypothetical protein
MPRLRDRHVRPVPPPPKPVGAVTLLQAKREVLKQMMRDRFAAAHAAGSTAYVLDISVAIRKIDQQIADEKKRRGAAA